MVTQTLQSCGYFIVFAGVRSEKLQNQSGPGAGAYNFSDKSGAGICRRIRAKDLEPYRVDRGIGAEIYRFIWSQELELVDWHRTMSSKL